MIQEYLTVSIYSIYSAQSNKEESLPPYQLSCFYGYSTRGDTRDITLRKDN